MTPQYNIPKELLRKPLLLSLFHVLKTWAFIICLIFIFSNSENFIVRALVPVLIGVFQYHLNILGHDGLHYSLAPKKKINDFICRWLLHGPCFSPLTMMRANHIHHHLNLGMVTDTDQQYYRIERFTKPSHFAIWLLSSLVGGMTFPIIKKLLGSNKNKEKITEGIVTKLLKNSLDLSSVFLTQLILFVLIYQITGDVLAYLKLWVLPIFTIMMGLNTIRSCLEHALPNQTGNGDRMFTFTSSCLERFFLAPFNMNHHAEHHLMMGVSFHQLPNLRKIYLANNNIFPEQIQTTYLNRFMYLMLNFERIN